MQKNIINLEEWSESKEILNSKPNRMVTVFLVIILLLIISLFVWSYFGKIDEYTKAVGMVRPGEEIRTISGKPGEIEKVYVEEGQIIQENDPLFDINNSATTIKKEEVDQQIATIEEEIELLHSYKDGVTARKNTISGDGELPEKYKNELDKYLIKQESIQKEINLLQNMEKETDNFVTTQHSKIAREVDEINNEIKQYQDLEQKIVNGKDISLSKHTNTYVLYQNYQTELNSIQNEFDKQMEIAKKQQQQSSEQAIQNAEQVQDQKQEQNQEQLLATTNIQANSVSVEELESDKKEAIQKLKNNYHSQILTTINTLESEKRSIELNAHQPSNSQYGLQLNQVLSTQKELEKDTIVGINDSIQQLESQLISLQSQSKLNEEDKKSSQILAPITGIVELSQSINEGDQLQGGEKILSIVPKEIDAYKIKLTIPSSEIGNIKVGDHINFKFDSLSKQENKRITGEITYISSDSVFDQETNTSYFVAESTIPIKTLQENDIAIKIGMACEAHIVYDSKRILDFVLEKLDFI